MNDDELNRLLQSAPLPQRPAEYWERFPEKVLRAIRHRPERSAAPGSSVAGFAILGLAAACLAIGLFVQFEKSRTAAGATAELANARKFYAEVEALFPRQVRAIVFDSKGPHLLLATGQEVASATPLYLKLCARNGCEEVVTFSGQEIPFGGQNCQVLAEADGQIMVVGDHAVWNQEKRADAISIAAEPLLPVSTL